MEKKKGKQLEGRKYSILKTIITVLSVAWMIALFGFCPLGVGICIRASIFAIGIMIEMPIIIAVYLLIDYGLKAVRKRNIIFGVVAIGLGVVLGVVLGFIVFITLFFSLGPA